MPQGDHRINPRRSQHRNEGSEYGHRQKDKNCGHESVGIVWRNTEEKTHEPTQQECRAQNSRKQSDRDWYESFPDHHADHLVSLSPSAIRRPISRTRRSTENVIVP